MIQKKKIIMNPQRNERTTKAFKAKATTKKEI